MTSLTIKTFIANLVGVNVFEFLRYNIGLKQYIKTNQRVFDRLLFPDDIVFDIGANIGGMTHYFSKNCVNGNVYSFEPNSYNYNLLLKTIRRYKLRNIFHFNMAVGNKNDVLRLAIPTMGKYNINTRSTISSNTISEYEMDKKIILNYQETKMITLDTFCFERKINKIDFIKEDTEGSLTEVIQGGVDIIKSTLPTFYVELGIKENPPKTLSDLGYKRYVVSDDSTIHPFDSCDGINKYDRTNALFIHESKLNKYVHV